jgi:hypothetical protein
MRVGAAVIDARPIISCGAGIIISSIWISAARVGGLAGTIINVGPALVVGSTRVSAALAGLVADIGIGLVVDSSGVSASLAGSIIH